MGKITKKRVLKSAKSPSFLSYYKKPKRNKINNMVRNMIVQFMEEDSNSRLCAGKKEYITKNKERKQKRVLTDTMKNLHNKFVSGYMTISYSMFCQLRPFWIVQPRSNDRDTCLCITHTNFDLLLQSLNQKNIIAIPNHQKLLEYICCNRYSPHCMTRHIKYEQFENSAPINLKQWEITTEEIVDAKSKNPRRIRKYSKKPLKVHPRDVILRLENSMPKFFNHQLNIVHQYNEIKKLKDTISHEDCVIHMDFSENYNTKYSHEIQAFHFGGSRLQISMHTVVYYTRNIDGTINTTCACTFSNNLAHGPAAIWAHLMPIFKRLPKHVVNLHFLSDGR